VKSRVWNRSSARLTLNSSKLLRHKLRRLQNSIITETKQKKRLPY